jgi:hypothetical protein
MSQTFHVLIDASPIRYPNGLWYYTLDLISDLKEIGIEIYIIPPKFHDKNSIDVHYTNIIWGHVLSLSGKFYKVFIPTLAIRFYRKQFIIVHDKWPFIQPNKLKSVLAIIALRILQIFSKIITISRHHEKYFKSDLYLPNKFPNITLESNLTLIECDYLIIGTETLRKNIKKCITLIKIIDSKKSHRSSLVIVGDNEQKFCLDSVDVSYVNSNNLNRIYNRAGLGFYISLSLEEGFNRGAAIALQKGFKLILSDIPAHREFFSGLAIFISLIEIDLNSVNFVDNIFNNTCVTNKEEIINIKEKLERIRQNVLQNIFK